MMRSACLSRQVGCALMDSAGTLIATGTNEAPRAGGGVYGETFELGVEGLSGPEIARIMGATPRNPWNDYEWDLEDTLGRPRTVKILGRQLGERVLLDRLVSEIIGLRDDGARKRRRAR